MLTRFGAERECGVALLIVVTLGLSGCGGLSKMQDILTDKPSNGQQQAPKPASDPKPGTAQQPSIATPAADPLPLPPY
jgi:hypothetical protein